MVRSPRHLRLKTQGTHLKLTPYQDRGVHQPIRSSMETKTFAVETALVEAVIAAIYSAAPVEPAMTATADAKLQTR